MDHDSNQRKGEHSSRKMSRRSVLKSTSVAVAGMAGIGATSGAVTAGEIKECASGWADNPNPQQQPQINLELSDPEHYNFEPGEGDWDDYIIYVHGWNSAETYLNQVYTLEQAFAEHTDDYDKIVIANWAESSDTFFFRTGYRRAKTAGERLAEWIKDNVDDGWGGDTVRLVGHSLGARAVLNTLRKLAIDDGPSVDEVALLGAAEKADTVCDGGHYAAGIEHKASRVDSYHSESDFAVCTAFETAMWEHGNGLGCTGPNCHHTASGFHAHDVIADVDGHCGYVTYNGQPDPDSDGSEADILENLGIIEDDDSSWGWW